MTTTNFITTLISTPTARALLILHIESHCAVPMDTVLFILKPHDTHALALWTSLEDCWVELYLRVVPLYRCESDGFAAILSNPRNSEKVPSLNSKKFPEILGKKQESWKFFFRNSEFFLRIIFFFHFRNSEFQDSWNFDPHGVHDFLFLGPMSRGKGLGWRLLTAVEGLAREAAVPEERLQFYYRSGNSKFYKARHGYKTHPTFAEQTSEFIAERILPFELVRKIIS